VSKNPDLRKCVDDHCPLCIYNPEVARTWRQQVTLCPVTDCPLHPVRPITKAQISESVLDYYEIKGGERAFYRRSRHLDALLSAHERAQRCRREGRD